MRRIQERNGRQSGRCSWSTTKRECCPEDQEEKVFLEELYTMDPVHTQIPLTLPSTYIQNVIFDHHPSSPVHCKSPSTPSQTTAEVLKGSSFDPGSHSTLFSTQQAGWFFLKVSQNISLLLNDADHSIRGGLSVVHLTSQYGVIHW